jgi:hypothetical protein
MGKPGFQLVMMEEATKTGKKILWTEVTGLFSGKRP